MRIEKLSIKNYKVYADAEVGNLPNLCVFLGANGAGKSSLFDVFGFLSDALKGNVKTALNKRGGFAEVRSRNATGPIVFEIKFRNPSVNRSRQPLVTYLLEIDSDNGQPYVCKEELSYRRGQRGKPFKFLSFRKGKGEAIINEEEFEVEKQDFQPKREEQELDSPDILALKGLGQFQKFKAISGFRKLLENWFVSNFQVQAAQGFEDVGLSEHLSPSGNNLATVTKFIYDYHRNLFDEILEKMKQRVPGIEKVIASETEDGRIVLKFQDGSFKDPFISRYVSDGTLKMFAYLILLNDPNPHPLLCIEEPENFLHHELYNELVEEFREYAQRGGQVFVSTHSPDIVNAIQIEELFWLRKSEGYTTIKKASDESIVVKMYAEGISLGALWRQGHLQGSGPKHY